MSSDRKQFKKSIEISSTPDLAKTLETPAIIKGTIVDNTLLMTKELEDAGILRLKEANEFIKASRTQIDILREATSSMEKRFHTIADSTPIEEREILEHTIEKCNNATDAIETACDKFEEIKRGSSAHNSHKFLSKLFLDWNSENPTKHDDSIKKILPGYLPGLKEKFLELQNTFNKMKLEDNTVTFSSACNKELASSDDPKNQRLINMSMAISSYNESLDALKLLVKSNEAETTNTLNSTEIKMTLAEHRTNISLETSNPPTLDTIKEEDSEKSQTSTIETDAKENEDDERPSFRS